MDANSAIISKVYYDLSGHGSMHETAKDAKDIDKSIECSVVKAWLDNRIKIKSAVKGTNSFVAKGPYQEYQLDLMCIKHLTKCFCVMLIYISSIALTIQLNKDSNRSALTTIYPTIQWSVSAGLYPKEIICYQSSNVFLSIVAETSFMTVSPSCSSTYTRKTP